MLDVIQRNLLESLSQTHADFRRKVGCLKETICPHARKALVQNSRCQSAKSVVGAVNQLPTGRIVASLKAGNQACKSCRLIIDHRSWSCVRDDCVVRAMGKQPG